MTTLDLFPDTVPTADPLIGRAVCTAPVCFSCGTNVALISSGRGPHAAELRCRNCAAHRQWLSHTDYKTIARFFAEFENEFGAPAEIIYRLPNKTECEMSDDRKYDNSRILFRNDKTKDSDRDYKGDATINAVTYWVSGWIKQGKRGKFLTLSFTPKAAAKAASTKTRTEEMADEVPF